jgi:hypothetical protein
MCKAALFKASCVCVKRLYSKRLTVLMDAQWMSSMLEKRDRARE